MKIFDCHSDTMADIRNRVFAGEHDVIRNRHLPLYDKGGVSGLLYAIYLDADLDMGGVYNSESGTWSGARFMPISGAYRLDSDDATTQLNSVWGGVFDGQGHKVYNIYASLSNTSWAESVGFIGRVGCHDKDEAALRRSGHRDHH